MLKDQIMMKKGLAAFRSNIDAAFLDQILMLEILFAHVSRQDHDEEGVGCV